MIFSGSALIYTRNGLNVEKALKHLLVLRSGLKVCLKYMSAQMRMCRMMFS